MFSSRVSEDKRGGRQQFQNLVVDVQSCVTEQRRHCAQGSGSPGVSQCRQFADILDECSSSKKAEDVQRKGRRLFPQQWSSGGSTSDQLKLCKEQCGNSTSSSDNESESETDSGEGWGKVFACRSPLSRAPTTRCRRASLELHHHNNQPHHRPPLRNPRRASLDSRHSFPRNDTGAFPRRSSESSESPGYANGLSAATPGRGRRLSMEEDREAAVYYGSRESSSGAGVFPTSRSLASTSSRRRSGSSRDKDFCLQQLVCGGEGLRGSEGDCYAADIIPPMSTRSAGRRQSLDIDTRCGASESMPCGQPPAFSYKGLGNMLNARSPRDLSAANSGCGGMMCMSGEEVGYLDRLEQQQLVPEFLDSAVQRPRAVSLRPTVVLPGWSGTETEEMETSEASDAYEFLHPTHLRRPASAEIRFTSSRAQRSFASAAVLSGPHTMLDEACILDCTTDDAETSDASNEGEFLRATAHGVAGHSRSRGTTSLNAQDGERAAGLPGNLANAWEVARSHWKKGKQGNGKESRRSFVMNIFRK